MYSGGKTHTQNKVLVIMEDITNSPPFLKSYMATWSEL